MDIVGHEIRQEGYTKEFDLGDTAQIIPIIMGGNSTEGKCDYHYGGSKDASLGTLRVGGGANDGAAAGLGTFRSRDGVSSSSTDIGFRSVSGFVSFQE